MILVTDFVDVQFIKNLSLTRTYTNISYASQNRIANYIRRTEKIAKAANMPRYIITWDDGREYLECSPMYIFYYFDKLAEKRQRRTQWYARSNSREASIPLGYHDSQVEAVIACLEHAVSVGMRESPAWQERFERIFFNYQEYEYTVFPPKNLLK